MDLLTKFGVMIKWCMAVWSSKSLSIFSSLCRKLNVHVNETIYLKNTYFVGLFCSIHDNIFLSLAIYSNMVRWLLFIFKMTIQVWFVFFRCLSVNVPQTTVETPHEMMRRETIGITHIERQHTTPHHTDSEWYWIKCHVRYCGWTLGQSTLV